MTVQSGKFSVINTIHTAQSWALNMPAESKAFGASNTKGGTGRRKGNRDWNGSLVQLTAIPTIMPNDYFDFAGFTGDEAGVGTGTRYFGNAIVDSVAITWNWASGEIISSQINFSGNGKIESEIPVTPPEDTTFPDAPSTIETKIMYGDTPVEWTDLTQSTLTITAATQPYVNSSTIETISTKKYAFTKRRTGKIDWSLSVTEQNSAGLPATRDFQSDILLQLYVDDTDYWELAHGHISGVTGINANNDTGAIIEQTYNIAMNAAKEGETQTGRIVKPGGALWWGTAAP